MYCVVVNMRSKRYSLLVALTLVAVFNPSKVFSAPFSSQQSCTSVCKRSTESSKLKYEQGNSYIYDFETKVSTKLVGTTDEESNIKVRGQAILAAQSTCDFILTVQQSVIEGKGGKRVSGENELEGSSIRFGFQDGTVEGLCAESGESVWVTNFKRALVSMFQNKAIEAVGDATVMEVDISGRCPTKYTFSETTYTKTRDLNKCSYREGGKWISQGIPYTSFSDQNSNPAVDSDLTCTQELSPDGIFKTVKCLETNKVKPLSSGQAGAQTIIDSKLTLVQTKTELPTLKASVIFAPSIMLFDHSDIDVSPKTRRTTNTNLIELLTKLCAEVGSGTVSSKVPGLFLQLKKTLRSAQGDDFRSIYGKVQDGSICASPVGKEKLEKLFIDAAIATTSTDAIVLIANLIEQGKLQRHTEELFVLYTSYASRPQEPALKALRTLISNPNTRSNFLLAASGLAHQYCKSTNPECASNAEYISLVESIAKLANDNCATELKDSVATKKAVSALQALGNLDSLPTEAVQVISNCLKSSTVSNRIKIRALDSFRSDPCQKDLKKQSFAIFKNKEFPSEVRIHAYLSSTRCLEQEDVVSLENVLNDEESNQVGSFVSSHIANIISNSNPGKQGTRTAFKQIRITKSFPVDPRVFSRNFELSAFNNKNNIGFSAEGNVIYSQDSYIPRTTTGNLTVDLFGRSYQLFEYGLYLENFEKVLETYFGPNGLFSKNPQTEVVKELRSRFSTLKSDVQSRFRRDTNTVNFNEIDSIHNEVKEIKERYGENGGFGDFYVRALGISIFSESFTQEEINQQYLTKSLLSLIDKFMEGAKDHKIEVTEPINFLNEEVILPTISGFPLNIQLEGTTVLSLQLQGNLDILALMGRSKGAETEIKSRVLPSAATIVKAKMSLGAGPVESGLQMEGKIHTASGIDIAVTRQANKFELKFNIPEEKIQLMDINTELFWVDQTGGELLTKSPLNSKLEERSIIENQCTEALSGITGLKFCANVKFPTFSADEAPLFPLTGNSVLSLSMKKVDAEMEGYYLKIDTGSESDTEKTVSIVLDTPGSRTNRKISADGRFIDGQSPKIELNIASPWSNARMDYQRWNEELLQGIEITAKVDEVTISGVAKLKYIPNGDIGMTYEPTVSYSFPGTSVNVLEGKVTRLFGKTMDIDLRADGQLRAVQGKISGSIQIDRKDSHNADFALSSIEFVNEALGKLFLDGSFGLKETGTTLNLNAKYGADAEHDLALSGEYSEPTTKSKIFDVKVASTRREFLNFDLRYESARSPNGFENTMLIHRGSDVATRLTLSHSSKYNYESSKQMDIENLIQITYPKRSWDFYLKADTKNGPVHQSANFQLRSGSAVNAVVKYDATGDDLSNYDFIGSINYPGLLVKFSEIGKKISDENWNYKSSFLTERDGQSPFKFDMDTDLTLRFRQSDILTEVNSKLSSSAFSEPFSLNSKLNGQPEFYLASIKLSQPSGDILSLGTEYRAALGNNPSTFSSKAFLIYYLDAKLVGTRDRSFSKLNLDVLWVPSGRKITLISDLKGQGQGYNLDTNLMWDATRDQSKWANIKSVIAFQNGQLGIQTTNDFTIQGKSSKLILNGKLANDYLNGENALDVNFQDSTAARYIFGLNVMNENKVKTKGIDLGIKFVLPNQSPFEMKLTNRLSNIDFVKYIFEFSTDVKVSYMENKNLNLQAELNSILTNKRTFSGKLDVRGSAIVQPFRLDHTFEIQSGHFKMAVSGTRGSKGGDFEFETSYDLWSPKKTIDYRYKVNTPFQAYRNLELTSKYSYLFSDWTNFDISEAGRMTVNNGNPSTWDNVISFIGQEFKSRYNITAEGNSIVAFSLSGRALTKKIIVTILNSVKEGDIKLSIDSDRNFPNLNLRIITTSPYKSYENMDFRIKHRVAPAVHNYETTIQAKRSAQLFTISNKLEYSRTKKSINLILTGDDSPSRKLYISLNEEESGKHSVDAVIRWDDGKVISTKGELLRSGESIVGDLSLDSPLLSVVGWSMHIAKEPKGGRQKLAITVKSAEEDVGHLIFDYSQTGNDALTRYDGTMNVKARTVNFEGIFQADNRNYIQNRDGEEGREVKAILQFSTESYPIKLEFIGKRTNADSKVSASFCNEDEQDCKILEFSLLTRANEYTLSAVSKSIAAGRKPEADTFLVRTATSGSNYEHYVKLRSSGDTDQEIGYKIYRYPDISQPKAGIEFWLPERKVVVLLSQKRSEYSLEAWMNKMKKPEDKLAITFAQVPLSITNDTNAWGREISLVLLHPLLTKELKIKTRSLYGGAKTLADISAEIDIFNNNQQLVLKFKVDRELLSQRSEGETTRVYSIDLGIHSTAQGLSLDIHSDVNAIGTDFTTKSKFVYLNREQQQRNYEIILDYMPDRRSFEVTGPSGRILLYSSSYNLHSLPSSTISDGYDVRREIFLPGMVDTRIFQNTLTTSFPPKMHIKMFTVSSPPGQFYETWIGFRNDKHFSSGIYGHEDHGQVVLGDFNIALNNSRLLFVKADWDNENIKEVLIKAQTRLQDTASRFKTLTAESVDYLSKEIDYQTSLLLKSLPSLRPVLKSYQAELMDITDEFSSSEIVLSTLDYFELILNIFGTDYEDLKIELDEWMVGYMQMFETFQEFLKRLPEMFTRTIDRIPAAWSTAQNGLSIAFDVLVNTTSSALRQISDLVDRLSTFSPNVTDNAGLLSDTTQGFGKFLKQTMISALKTLTEVWTSAKFATQELLESDYVKSIIMDLTMRYENQLGDTIDEYKKQADKLREAIIKTLPEKEFQELVRSILEYVEKKVKKVFVDDAAAQKDIYNKFVTAIEKANSNIFTVDLKNGLILAQIPLPVPVKSLWDIGQVFEVSLPVIPPPSTKCSLTDVWNMLTRINSLRDLLPPFESHAYIVGSQYYRTFDGKFFHFEGNCQYVLAADFAEKNFTIVVDFKKDTGSEVKKSIIMTDNKNIVVIQPDNTVLFNGQRTEAVYNGDYYFSQVGDWVSVRLGNSYTVECSNTQDVCTVKINGFYLGKTRGLLGTYNHEIFDDLMAPSGVLQDSFEKMVPLWKVGRQCQERPLPTHSLVNNLDAVEKCKNSFGESSSLSSCFETINPSEFETVCTSLAEEKGYNLQRAVCTAAYSYTKMCQNSGIEIDSSKFCKK